jgi:hypothetical protein
MNKPSILLNASLPLCFLGLLAAGCSTFDKDWEAWKASNPASTEEVSLDGPWEGFWKSSATGQTGALRWIIIQGEDGQHRIRRQTRYAGVFKSEHILPLHVQVQGDRVRVHGEVDLGTFGGGKCQYQGQLEGQELVVEYRSKYDYGAYRLRRP